ncbi:MAG: DUF1223 domain-containing protein [Bdellovibrionales bacterium]
MNKWATNSIGSLLLVAVSAPGGAKELARSGAQQVTLVELYTSEGCSSCPPADAQMSRLRRDPGLWKKFVPVGLHVDYWDYLGWKDAFALPQNSARQRAYAKSLGHESVYTPAFFINGRPTRPPFTWTTGKNVGELILSQEADEFEIRFSPTGSQTHIEAMAVLMQSGVKSEVSRGENSGHQLKHDFVVREMKSVSLKRNKKDWAGKFTFSSRIQSTEPLSLAVWVYHQGSPTPIQSVGGNLSKEPPL